LSNNEKKTRNSTSKTIKIERSKQGQFKQYYLNVAKLQKINLSETARNKYKKIKSIQEIIFNIKRYGIRL
jgi:hypothetical protein